MLFFGCSDPAPEFPATDDAEAVAADVSASPAEDALAGDGTPLSDDAGAFTSPVELPTGAKALVLDVSPAQGPTGGLETVEISGVGFSITDQVFFGESPALEVEIVDDNTLSVVTPPRPAGLVDVTVRLDDAIPAKGIEATEVTLPLAYRFVADVKIVSIAPKKGGVSGGTLVTVTGSGFGPGTQFAFGDRLGIDPLVVDDNTAAVHTPPGVAGFVDVTVANPDGSATLKKGFVYSAPPKLTYVSPATASTSGGGTVVLHGAGLLAVGGVVSVLGADGFTATAQVQAANAEATMLTVVVPPNAKAGVYGLRYSSVHGYAEIHDSLVYVGATPSESAIETVAPKSVFSNVPAAVAISLSGPIAALEKGTVAVTIDGSPCQVLDHNIAAGNKSATVVVLSPKLGGAGWPAKVDVHVKVNNVGAFAKEKLMVLPPKPQIQKVSPKQINPVGGSKVTVTVGPSPTAFGSLIGVRIGAMYATDVVWKHEKGTAEAEIDVVAPKGSPGPADLLVVFENGELSAEAAFEYAAPVPILGALKPGRGAQAGGTAAQILGSGLHLAKRIFVGDEEVKTFKIVHAGLIELKTPRGDPGSADLEVWFANGLDKQVLQNAFVYFDPTAGNYGTWGPAIDGAVNVTVMQSSSPQGPLVGATVVVGTDPHTPHRGKTDDRGQITFSAKIFKGPIVVSATKAGYTAASVVAVNTENVTLRIRKHPVPSSGSPAPDTEDPFPDGTITGTVVNANKYLQLPMGDCEKAQPLGGHCQPCSNDAQCTNKTTCELLADPLAGFNVGADGGLGEPTDGPVEATLTGQSVQKYCASACTENADCPSSYECRAISWQPGNTKFRCTPSIGKAEIRCETSSPSIYGGNPPAGPGASVDGQHKFTINSRLGDLSVICRAGYIESGTGDFKVLSMGVTPHVNVAPGQTTSGVEVLVNIPLNRRVRVRLDQIPMGEDAKTHRRELDVAIDLDPEGYIVMGGVSTTNLTDVLVLENQPSALSGPLAGKPYTMYGGVRKLTGGSPVSLAMAEHLHPENSDFIAFWPKADAKPLKSTAMSVAVNAMATSGSSTWAVGDKGYIGVWSGTGFTQQASPTGRDLFAVWALEGSSEAWAGGSEGTLLRRHSLGWNAVASPTSKAIIAITGSGKDKVWLLTDDNTMIRRAGGGWLTVSGPIKQAKPKTAWYQLDSDRLLALHQADDGSLIAAGHNGGLWVASPSESSVFLSWTKIDTATKYSIRALWGASKSDFFFAGDRGYFGRYGAGTLQVFEQKTDRPLYAIGGASDGVHAVGGLGAWVRVDSNGKVTDQSVKGLYSDLRGVAEVAGGRVAAGQPVIVMGPFLEMPYFDLPKATDDLGSTIKWSFLPGVTPTLNMVRVTNYGYTTMWEMFVKGSVDEVELPDFTLFDEVSPLPSGQLRVRLWRIYAPGLDIDHFNHKQLSIWRWVSYAYNWMLTSQVNGAVEAVLPKSPGPGSSLPSIPPDPSF